MTPVSKKHFSPRGATAISKASVTPYILKKNEDRPFYLLAHECDAEYWGVWDQGFKQWAVPAIHPYGRAVMYWSSLTEGYLRASAHPREQNPVVPI